MTTETALPTADQATAGQDDNQTAEQRAELAALTEKNRAIDEADDKTDGEGEKTKTEKTPEQREIERLRRGIDRRTRQLSDARAQLDLTRGEKGTNYQNTADDSQPLSLTRAEIAELVKAEAAKLAPTIREEALETERRQGVIQSLAKTWGQEKFNELSSDLDDAFGGLTDRSGKPKPAIEAIFEADEPARVIEFLADPDNIDEAERIAKLSAVQAGKAIAKLEAKLTNQAPPSKVSKAPPPLEQVRGQGKSTEKRLSDLSGKEFAERRAQQIKQRQ